MLIYSRLYLEEHGLNPNDLFLCGQDNSGSAGDIELETATDPAWTPIFARAVGIVVELGGALSHAGIVAREFGIPCVANIRGLTSLLQNGDLVRLDGTSGLVTILSCARELPDQQKVADRSNP